jgi:tetratricopeptide (TPR) repeat protein
LLFDAGRRGESLVETQNALDYDPLNAGLYYDIGFVHREMDNLDLALAAHERSLELKPGQPNVYGELVRIKAAIGDGVGIFENLIKAMEVDSQDHELPSNIANRLYRFDLIEEGDTFRDRAMLMAPNSPTARHANLQRAIAVGDREKSLELARSMIVDNIEDRHGAYFNAVITVLHDATQSGTAPDALEFMESYQPGFNDVESATIDFKVRNAQWAAFVAWAATMPADEFRNRIDAYWRVIESQGVTPEDDPHTYMRVLAVRGETEAAIEFGLANVFNEPITITISWNNFWDLPHMQLVVADPRVQEQLQRWETEKIDTRERIRIFLAGRSE